MWWRHCENHLLLFWGGSEGFQICYLEKWIFTSIERELHVPNPYLQRTWQIVLRSIKMWQYVEVCSVRVRWTETLIDQQGVENLLIRRGKLKTRRKTSRSRLNLPSVGFAQGNANPCSILPHKCKTGDLNNYYLAFVRAGCDAYVMSSKEETIRYVLISIWLLAAFFVLSFQR